jgi:hypothetical protein
VASFIGCIRNSIKLKKEEQEEQLEKEAEKVKDPETGKSDRLFW